MSMWQTLFGGWRFGTARPAFREGDHLSVYVTGHEAGEGRVRIGDSVLTVPDVAAEEIDQLIEVRVLEFDAATGRGRAERVSASASGAAGI